MNLRKSSGHRPGVPGTLAGQTGVYQPASQGFPVVYCRKTDQKTFLLGHRSGHAGCPTDNRPFSGLSETSSIFFLCAFSAAYLCAQNNYLPFVKWEQCPSVIWSQLRPCLKILFYRYLEQHMPPHTPFLQRNLLHCPPRVMKPLEDVKTTYTCQKDT